MRRTWMLLAVIVALVCAPTAQAADFVVNTTGDGVDASCPTTCTLRAAIAAANAAPDDPEILDTITVPANTYQLTQGALRITGPVLLSGAGASTTTIVGRQSGGARVLEIVSTSATITGVALQGGEALEPSRPHGGALMAQSSTVVLNRVHVLGGSALSGGGIANRNGTMTIQQSSITHNTASPLGGGDGGGIINFGGDGGSAAHLTVRDSTIAFNTARLAGGLISYGNAGDTVAFEGVTIAQNRGGDRGTGGVQIDTPWQARFTVIADNLAQGFPSNCSGALASSQGWNVETGGECGFTQENDHQRVDAKLDTVVDYWGAATPSIRPRNDSPAVDIAITGTQCAPVDQRNVERPQGLICDAGAFELDYWVRVTTGPRGPITDASPEFEFRSARGATAFECRFEATAPYAPCSSPHRPPSALRDGDYAFSVRAVGQTETAERAFSVDNVAPVMTITSGPEEATNAQTAEFEFTASEPVLEVQCRLLTPDNGDVPYRPCTSPYRADTLAPGAHEFQVQATDLAGNFGEPASRTFVVDRDPPAMPVILQPANESYTNDATLELSGTAEPGVTVPISLGADVLAVGEADAQGAWSALITDLPEGDLTLQAPAVDAAGNRSAPAYLVVHSDRTEPVTRIESAPPVRTNQTTVEFTYAADEPATFTCRLNGPGISEDELPCEAAGRRYEGLANGDYQFRVRARDRAGNADDGAEVYPFTINTALPDVPVITSPQADPSFTRGDRVVLEGTGGAGSTVEVVEEDSVRGSAPVVDGRWRVEFAAAEGEHRYAVRARDDDGESVSVQRTITVDRTAPTVALTAPPRYLASSGIEFAPASPDPEATLACKLNTATAACTSMYDLIDGASYTWTATAIDRAGNESAPVEVAFVYRNFRSTIAPDGWESPANDATPSFTLSGGSAYTCWIDDTPVACGPALTLGPLADGDHVLRVRGRDASGIEEESEQIFAFAVDTGAPPPPAIGEPADGEEITTDSVRIVGLTERLSEVEVFDGATSLGMADVQDEGAGQWSLEVDDLAQGEHVFTAVAIDDAGNRSAPSAPVRILVRLPALTIDSGPPAVTRETTARFTFATELANPTFTCALDGADPTDCPAAYENLADGEHVLRVVAVDPDGARSAVATHTWRVDRTPPAATAVTPGDPGVFTFASAEPGVSYACRLNDGAFEACASPQTYPGLGPGAYTFTLRTIDAAGNATDSPATPFVVAAAAAAQPTATPAPTVTPAPTPRATPQPEQGETVVTRPVAGKVLVKLPGLNTFVELKSIEGLPLGATIDAKNGRVQLRFESEPGKVQTALFYGGIFQVTQRGKVLDLKLVEELAPCPKKKSGKASAAQKKPKKRKLWGDGKGSFRTSGKYSAATVRGTRWLVEDSCAGTLTRVTSGVVAVRDRKKTVLVRAGKRYLAKAR